MTLTDQSKCIQELNTIIKENQDLLERLSFDKDRLDGAPLAQDKIQAKITSITERIRCLEVLRENLTKEAAIPLKAVSTE